MIVAKLSSLTAEHIQALVADEVRERRDLDFKEKLPDRGDAASDDFIADVCAFANSGGGDIVYGIEDKKDENGRPTGVAGAIVGLMRVNPDDELRRLVQLIERHIQPKVFGLDWTLVEGLGGGPVVVLRIPPSYNGPHLTTYKGQQRFYTRVASQKRLLDVDEIRNAFLASESASDRLRDFRAKRLAEIANDVLPVPLMDSPGRLIVHIVPISGFVGRAPMVDPRAAEDLVYPPSGAPHAGYYYNLDGIVGYRSGGGDKVTYLQVFRNGALELVYVGCVEPTTEAPVLADQWIDTRIRSSLEHGLKVLRSLDRPPPYVLMASLLGVKGAVIRDRWADPTIRHLRYPRSDLMLPDVWIESESPDHDDVVRPIMDIVWQACGHGQSPDYDERGRRRLRER